jgi:transposase-like protein
MPNREERGLKSIELVTSGEHLGLVEALGQFCPDAQGQKCGVHFYRNAFSMMPKGKVEEVVKIGKRFP